MPTYRAKTGFTFRPTLYSSKESESPACGAFSLVRLEWSFRLYSSKVTKNNYVMKKQSTYTQAFVGALILTLGFLPAAAFARESEGAGVSAQGTITTHVETEGDGISAGSGITTGVSGGDQNDGNKNENVSGSERHQDSKSDSANSGRESDENDNEIEIDQDSAGTATSTTIDTPERVTKHGELRSFLNHIVKEDERIADVHVSTSTIETHYALPAKFLWTIPMDLTADVAVQSDGSVTITYPWYAFLFAKHGDELASKLEQSVASTSAGASTTLSSSDRAHLLNLLFSTLKSATQ